eukprot:2235925-Amphidinium_carterae.3
MQGGVLWGDPNALADRPGCYAAVTSGRTPWHVDQNDGFTTLTAVGDFQGGQLILQLPDKNTKTFSIKRRWLMFHALHQHSTGPSEGNRLALSYYVPKMHDKLLPFKHELLQLGFPVQDLWPSTASSSTLAANALQNSTCSVHPLVHKLSERSALVSSTSMDSRSHVDQVALEWTRRDAESRAAPTSNAGHHQL